MITLESIGLTADSIKRHIQASPIKRPTKPPIKGTPVSEIHARPDPILSIHARLMARCYPKDGTGKAIVCDRWHDPDLFYRDMADGWRVGLSLGRKDPSRPYSPENCRWETASDKARSIRRSRMLTVGGVTKTVGEWADQMGVPCEKIHKTMNLKAQ